VGNFEKETPPKRVHYHLRVFERGELGLSDVSIELTKRDGGSPFGLQLQGIAAAAPHRQSSSGTRG
jgi:hypothetical protein